MTGRAAETLPQSHDTQREGGRGTQRKRNLQSEKQGEKLSQLQCKVGAALGPQNPVIANKILNFQRSALSFNVLKTHKSILIEASFYINYYKSIVYFIK